jgi:hypothetical protein
MRQNTAVRIRATVEWARHRGRRPRFGHDRHRAQWGCVSTFRATSPPAPPLSMAIPCRAPKDGRLTPVPRPHTTTDRRGWCCQECAISGWTAARSPAATTLPARSVDLALHRRGTELAPPCRAGSDSRADCLLAPSRPLALDGRRGGALPRCPGSGRASDTRRSIPQASLDFVEALLMRELPSDRPLVALHDPRRPRRGNLRRHR